MAENLQHAPAIVEFWANHNEYVLPVYNGAPEDGCKGSAGVMIEYCPWCGSKLPPSTR